VAYSTTISIKNNFPAVIARLNQVAVDVGNKAMVRALNATVEQGKIQMARQINAEFRISVGDAKKRLRVDRATAKGGYRFSAFLEATRRGQGRSMNIIAFVTKGRVSKAAAKRQGRAGLAGQIQFQIKRGGGKKVIPGAFIGNKGRTLFIRTGKARLPIEPLNTIDQPQMFNSKRVNSVVRQVMLAKFEANFQRELRVVLKGYVR